MTGTVANFLTFPLDPGPGPDAAVPGREPRDSPDVEACLSSARAGDAEAFGRLVDLYQRVAVRTALVALGRREDAEDVAQEAFLLAWRKLAGFRGDSTFRTWLLTIVWRKALDRRRVRSLWWKRSPGHSLTDAPIDRVPAASMTPEQATVARDHVRRVRDEIAKLSPTLRDTLLLAASGEYTYDQIAMLLRVPLGTVKWRVAEARRLVAMRLDQ